VVFFGGPEPVALRQKRAIGTTRKSSPMPTQIASSNRPTLGRAVALLAGTIAL
jgi:hypothetical protein